MSNGYRPTDDKSLDLTNPPTDFTAIELELLPKGYELIHDHDGFWYCGRHVKGGDFAPACKSAREALQRIRR